MNRTLAVLLGVAAACLAVCLAVPPRAGLWWWLAVLLTVVVVIELAVRTHRPAHPQAWRALGTGVGLFAVSVLVMLLVPAPTVGGFHPAAGLLLAAGYALLARGAARIAHAQAGGSDRGPFLDSVIVTISLTAVLWEAALVRSDLVSLTTDGELLGTLVSTALGAWVAAMTLRAFLAGGTPTTSGWAILGASVAGGAGCASLIWFGMPDGIPATTTLLLWGAGLLLLGVAAAHPSMRSLTEQVDVEVAHTIARTVLPAAALLAPPSAVVVRWLSAGQVAPVAAIASVLVAIVVVARFGLLVADRERARDLLHQQAQHDPLTGLANRRLLTDRLDHALRRRPDAIADLAVLFLDLDGFKSVNDRYGHAAGDGLLVELAGRLARVRRPQDTLARLGGDEFVLLADDVDVAAAMDIADRLLQAIRTPLPLDRGWVQLDASIGVAHVRDVGPDAHQLLRAADDAMYVAKGAGRGRIVPASGHADEPIH